MNVFNTINQSFNRSQNYTKKNFTFHAYNGTACAEFSVCKLGESHDTSQHVTMPHNNTAVFFTSSLFRQAVYSACLLPLKTHVLDLDGKETTNLMEI